MEGLAPAVDAAELSEDLMRGWVSDLSDAELPTLREIVEEQQATRRAAAEAASADSALAATAALADAAGMGRDEFLARHGPRDVEEPQMETLRRVA